MLESIILENPMAAVAVAIGLAVFVTLLVSAWVSSRRSKRRSAVPVRQEPVFAGGDTDRREAVPHHDASSSRADEPRSRRRYGFGALVLSFLIGAFVGLGGWSIASTGSLQPAIEALVGLAEAGMSRAREVAGLESPEKSIAEKAENDATPVEADESASVEPAETGEIASEIQARLAFFAGKLKGTLPRDAGPELVLTRVDVIGMTLDLGYTLGRSLDDDQTANFDTYVKRSVESLLCGKESRELRFLNDHGVAFRMDYTDLRGESVAKLAIPPGFCT